LFNFWDLGVRNITLDKIKLIMKLFGKKSSGGMFTLQNMSNVPFAPLNDSDTTYIEKGYGANADLFSVINLLTSNAGNIRLSVYDGDKQLDRHPIIDLLKEPMPGMTYSLWIAQVAGYYWLTGNSYLYAPWIEDGANRGKTIRLDYLPAQFIAIERQNGEKKYKQSAPVRKTYEEDEILHIRTVQYNAGAGSEDYGMSPIKAAILNLTSSNAGTKSQAARFANGGLDGMLSVKDAKTAEQIARMKKDINAQTGSDKNGRFLITNSEIQWVRFGLTPADLQILSTITWNLRVFCNIYKIDPKLLDPTVGNTYNNMREAYASMYNRAIIPFMTELAQGLTNFLAKRYGKTIRVEIDTSWVNELQRDRSQMAAWLSQAWWLTGNEKRKEMGFDVIDDPDMDVPLFPMNSIPSDFANEKNLNERGMPDYRT
jgi:HK97 family phage portal protein